MMRSRHATTIGSVLLTTGLLFNPQAVLSQPATESGEMAKAIQNEVKHQLERQRLQRARTKLQTSLTTAQTADETLRNLSTRLEAFNRRLTELLTNDDGKRIAQDENATDTVLRLREQPMLLPHEIKTRQETASSFVRLFTEQLHDPNVGQAPTDDALKKLWLLTDWAIKRSAELDQVEATLRDLVQNAPALSHPENAPVLGQILDEFVAERIRLWAKLLRQGEKVGRLEAKPKMIHAARLAELERAEAELKRIRDQATIDAERTRRESDLNLQLARQEAKARRAEFDRKLAEANAEIERLKKIAAARRHARDVKAQNLARSTFDTAEHDRKLALAKSPEVRQLLKPFTTPAYYQPRGKTSYERQPISLSTLRQLRALEKTPKGLWKLWEIACSVHDHERPRWAHRDRPSGLTPQQRDDARQAQQYLIELGDELIELGMLAP